VTFLNPGVLWVLPLTLIPLILHFIHKRPPKVIPFAYLDWLRKAHVVNFRRKRIHEILLLILRTLTILFLILFFSRPYLHKTGFFGSPSSQQTIICLVDISASMSTVVGGQSLLDSSKSALDDLIKKLPSQTLIGLLAYSNRIEKEIPPSTDRSFLLNSIKELEVKWRPTDIKPALQKAREFLGAFKTKAPFVLIASDHAKHGWTSFDEEGEKTESLPPEVQVVFFKMAESSKNAGVVTMDFRLDEKGYLAGYWKRVQTGFMDLPVPWKMNVNERLVTQGECLPTRKNQEEIFFETPLKVGGYFSGHISLEKDSASFDDIYYFAGRVPNKFKLLIVDGERSLTPSDSESFYLKSSLESPRDPRLELIQVVSPEDFSKENLKNYQVLVLANVSPLIQREEEIKKWMEAGGGLLLTSGNNWTQKNESFLGMVDAQGVVTKENSFSISTSSHSLFNYLTALENFEWAQTSLTKRMAFQNDASWDVGLKTFDGAPLFIGKKYGRGQINVLLFSADREWTNFPSKPVFSPFMRSVIFSLADPVLDDATYQLIVDEPIRISLVNKIKTVSIITPEGVSSAAQVDRNNKLIWKSVEKPGLYQVKTDTPADDFVFAVNIDKLEKESDLTLIEEGDIRNILKDNGVQWVASGENPGNRLLAAFQGKDGTFAILIILFSLFILETYFSNKAQKT
jgi:hypothetical protein